MTEHGPRGGSKSSQVSGGFREILEPRHHAADAVFGWLPPDPPEADGDVPGIAKTAHSSRLSGEVSGENRVETPPDRYRVRDRGSPAGRVSRSFWVKRVQTSPATRWAGELAEPSREKAQYPLVQKQRQAATHGEAQKGKYWRMGERRCQFIEQGAENAQHPQRGERQPDERLREAQHDKDRKTEGIPQEAQRHPDQACRGARFAVSVAR